VGKGGGVGPAERGPSKKKGGLCRGNDKGEKRDDGEKGEEEDPLQQAGGRDAIVPWAEAKKKEGGKGRKALRVPHQKKQKGATGPR